MWDSGALLAILNVVQTLVLAYIGARWPKTEQRINETHETVQNGKDAS